MVISDTPWSPAFILCRIYIPAYSSKYSVNRMCACRLCSSILILKLSRKKLEQNLMRIEYIRDAAILLWIELYLNELSTIYSLNISCVYITYISAILTTCAYLAYIYILCTLSRTLVYRAPDRIILDTEDSFLPRCPYLFLYLSHR